MYFHGRLYPRAICGLLFRDPLDGRNKDVETLMLENILERAPQNVDGVIMTILGESVASTSLHGRENCSLARGVTE